MRFEGVDIATSQLDKMKAFYTTVFDIEFDDVEYAGFRHAVGELGGVRFLLAPNEPANVADGTEGVHQFHLRVSDIGAIGTKATNAGCWFKDYGNGEACVRDPDGNPWMLRPIDES